MRTSPTSSMHNNFHGIVAPRPAVYTDIKRNQRIEVRPAEPIYLFIETRMGSGTQLEGLNKHTPFKVEDSQAPAGVPVPRTMGRWLKISVARGAKAGRSDRVKLVSSPVLGPAAQSKPTSIVPFTLTVGNMRYY